MNACLSLGWVESFLIWLVTLVFIVALLKLLVPLLFQALGFNGEIVVRIINLVVWCIVAIAAIILVFSLLGCLVPFGHLRY